jgi:sec-independent protein translocase protein TatC
MFYLKETAFRFQYYFLSFFSTLVVCFFNKNILLFLMTLSVTSFFNQQNLSVDHFIYTHPVELFTVQIFLIIYFSLLFTIPILFWNIVDFLKPSFILLEYRNFSKLTFLLFSLTVLFNNILCFYIFPNIWFFFHNFNTSYDVNQTFNFFLELRIYEYFSFLVTFFYLTNASIGFLVVCVSIFAFHDFENLIYWKKLFIFLNMVFATLLSPPDVYSQLFLFVFLTFLFESLIFIYLLHAKFKKYLFFSMASC